MSPFLQKLVEQRKKFLDGLDANEGDINLDIFEDFYPDQAHFVFELLQNAEDAGATEAVFILRDDACWFEHNGTRAFTEADVKAITGIHNSTKSKTQDARPDWQIWCRIQICVCLYANADCPLWRFLF